MAPTRRDVALASARFITDNRSPDNLRRSTLRGDHVAELLDRIRELEDAADPFAPGRIAVLEGDALRTVAVALTSSAEHGDAVRVVIDDGVKFSDGGTWTPPWGRLVDQNGR